MSVQKLEYHLNRRNQISFANIISLRVVLCAPHLSVCHAFLDNIINLIAEIKDAISEYEPRATVLNITLETDLNAPGKLHATVEVDIKDE